MLLQLSLTGFLLTFCHLSNAQVPFPNHCPEVKIKQDFQLDDYMGIWYEYAKYPFVFEIGKKCMFARYENIGDGMVSVVNAAVNRITGESSNVTGKAKVISSGALAVVFPRSSNQNFDKPNYLVLDTDYSSFVVVYSCSNFTPIAHTKIVWILTRERKPSEQTIATAKKVMADNNLPQTLLMETIQNDCPELNVNREDSSESGNLPVETTTNLDALTTTSNIIDKA